MLLSLLYIKTAMQILDIPAKFLTLNFPLRYEAVWKGHIKLAYS